MQDSKKDLLVHQDSGHLLLINAEDPSQCTYLRNLKKKTLLITWKLLSSISIAGTNQIKDLWYFIRGKGFPYFQAYCFTLRGLRRGQHFRLGEALVTGPFPIFTLASELSVG
jgi:hypothetical protein